MPYPKRKQLRVKRGVAFFILFTMLNQLMAPTLSFALTAGPTAPEATNFEPVDTTDMVNTLTGNFTYSLPLLEIPGPEGGYPLSLSYHGGIQPNEDASWVGLGWSLNPGAIARNVNGFADDFSDVNQARRDYWAGGSRSTFNISVGLYSGASFGLSFSQDTYQGFGVGVSGGYGYNLGFASIGGDISVDPYGGVSAGASLSAGYKLGESGLQLGGSIGLQTNFQSVSANAGAGVSVAGAKHSSVSLLGISMSTTSSKASLSIGGGSSSVYNAKAGKISTRSSGFGFFIPLPYFYVSLGYKYTKYWSDETANIYTNGSIYSPQQITDQSYFDTRTYDIYRLLDPVNSNIVDNNDPDKLQGGTFPDFDNYAVTAQGLAGSIRPYIFQSVLYSQNQTDIVQTSGASANGMVPANGIQYRFINDFSNSYRQAHPNMNSSNFQFGSPVYGNNDGDYGYSTITNRLAGSKSIAYFTNFQINSGEAKTNGFIDVPSNNGGFIRMGNSGSLTNTKGDKQIGGFTITNESGVSYHYALPAYEMNEFSKTAKSDESSYTTETKSEPYAYTWYLTAVTGPDFVDKNNNGLADDGDWGYWVTFDYGKWSGSYNWRNPSEGWQTDIDPNYKAFSQGTKELYYLDAIHTRSHTALFIKETRYDAKSVGVSGFDQYSATTLGLNNILLLQNDQFPTTINALRGTGRNTTPGGNYNNVLDIDDISTWAININQKCLRKIVFSHDYSLVPGTSNSFSGTAGIDDNKGKYSLLSVDFQGKGGTSVTPPIQFSYDLDPNDPANQSVVNITSAPSNMQGTIQVQSSGRFNPGDILKLSNGSSSYYCTLLSSSDNTNFNVQYLNVAPTGTMANLNGLRTKNPPYNKDAYDSWGMYKSDYVLVNNNENQSRNTTLLSNKSIDVWSLRNIQTSVGANIKINYEGDTYQRSILNNSKSAIVNGGSFDLTANTITVNVPNPQNIDLNNIYTVGQSIDGVFLYSRVISSQGRSNFTQNDKKAISISKYHPIVSSITGNTLQISVSPQYFTDLKTVDPSAIPQGNTVSNVVCTQLTGNLQSFAYGSTPGGGIRVKDISIDDLNGSIRKTAYNYSMLDLSSNPRISSGVTSYEPVTLDVDNIYSYLNSSIAAEANVIKDYHRILYAGINTVLTLARDAPAPGVMYEYVTVSDADVLPNGSEVPVEDKTTYQFRVFNKGMIGIVQYQNDQQTSTLYQKNLSIKDYTSQIGNPVRTIRYDTKGNKLSENINNYLNDDIVDKSFDVQNSGYEQRLVSYNYQGFVQERYADGRTFRSGSNWIYELTMSGRDQYPIIGTGTTQIDYVNGKTINRQDLSFDFYSGSVSKTLTFDSYGNRFINEVIPAYRQYPAMGVRVNNGALALINKNMLSQEAANYTYAVDLANNPIGVVSATAQTWSNAVPVLDPDGNTTTTGQSDIWRMQSSYSWLTAGSSTSNLAPYASFVSYFANGGNTNTSWKKTGQITQYNVYSNSLEANDINNNYAATRMGYNSSKVLFSGGPARYNEIAYAGAEDALLSNGKFSNNIALGQGTINIDTTKVHTGVKSLQVAPTSTGFTYTVPLIQLDPIARNYSAAVWVKASASDAAQTSLYYQVGSGAVKTPIQNLKKNAAGWYLLELTIPAPEITGTGNLIVGCKNNAATTVYFDDFRFQPTNASATAYVYDNQTGELTYTINNNNLFTRYQYDAIGRLVRIYKEVLGKAITPRVKAIAYNYGRIGGPTWQNTGTTRCQQAGGTNNGYLDTQQKDVNPQSPTYNQTRWVASTTMSSGCPVTIYARLDATYGSVTGPYGYNYGNYTVSLFSDPNGAYPYFVQSSYAQVNYRVTQSITDANGTPSSNVIDRVCTILAGQSSNGVGQIITYRCNASSTSPFNGGGGAAATASTESLSTTQSAKTASVASPQVVQPPPGGGTAPYCMNNAVALTPGSYTIIFNGNNN